jgi:hypothetical protein
VKYGKGTCGECGRSVMTEDGLAVKHPRPGAAYYSSCDGTGMPVEQIKPKPPPVQPPPVARPLGTAPMKILKPAAKKPPVDRNAVRLVALQEELDKGKPLQKAVEAVNEAVETGSIDFEALAECDCPSLREAVRRMLGRKS